MHLGQNHNFENSTAVAPYQASVAGLAQATTVMTLDGETVVEHLNVGDRIITRDSGIAILRDLHEAQAHFSPVHIKAGSLGHTRPHNDMIVGPDTLIHFRDWRAKVLFGADIATVKAKRLIDDEFVSQGAAKIVTVYQLVFDKQHIIYADGLEVASAAT